MTDKLKKPSRRRRLRAWERREIADDATPEQAARIMELQAQLRAHELFDRASAWARKAGERETAVATAARLRREAEAVNAAVDELARIRADGGQVH